MMKRNKLKSYTIIVIIFITIVIIMEYLMDTGESYAFIENPLYALFLIVLFITLVTIETVLSALSFLKYITATEEERKKIEEEQNKPLKEKAFFKKIIQRLTNSRPVTDNEEILLDHDYDGIKELDNKLPPWWVYLFYGCIMFAAVYMIRYEIVGGNGQMVEFENEMTVAKAAVEEYKKNAKDLIDVNSVVLLTDKEDIDKGKEIFDTNCMACHRNDGGGTIGPNLTDEYWILGGGIKNVFNTISEGGRDGKGMVAWKGNLKPSEIQQVASYVISLQGSNPTDAKEPEGEIWAEKENIETQKDE